VTAGAKFEEDVGMTGKQRFFSALDRDSRELCSEIASPEFPFRDRAWEHSHCPWWIMEEANAGKCVPVMRSYLERIACDRWNVLWTTPREERPPRLRWTGFDQWLTMLRMFGSFSIRCGGSPKQE